MKHGRREELELSIFNFFLCFRVFFLLFLFSFEVQSLRTLVTIGGRHSHVNV